MFGSRPFLAVKPVGLQDQEKARDLQKFCEHKFNDNRSGIESAVKDATLSAWGMGYGILKTSYVRDIQSYDTVIDALLDEAGNPIIGKSGRPITSSSETFFDPKKKGYVFADDPEERAFAEPNFSSITNSDYTVAYNGPELACVSYKDFIADPYCARLEDCEFIAHHQAYTVGELKDEYGLGMIDPDKYEEIINSAGSNKLPSRNDNDSYRDAGTSTVWSKERMLNLLTSQNAISIMSDQVKRMKTAT